MTEPEEPQSINNNSDSSKTEPVTAARRSGNLETIRKQPGWKRFPDCIPLIMRTTKSGKVTAFGNTKLRIIERIAIQADFANALAYLRSLTDDGSRMLSLKDLESCTAHFDGTKKASGQGGSSAAPGSVGPSQPDDDEPNYQIIHNFMDHWGHVGLDDAALAIHPGPPSNPLKRVSLDTTALTSMSQSPASSATKKPRMNTFFDPQTTDFLFSLPSPDLNTDTGLNLEPFPLQAGPSFRHDNPNLQCHASPNPSRALLSLHPQAGTIFSTLNSAFDELLARAEDQQKLVTAALDQLRVANGNLEASASMPSISDQLTDLEATLLMAQRLEAQARRDMEQARSARDILEIQYGHLENSLSRALLGSVRGEYTRAETSFRHAQSEVDIARQRIGRANNHEAALRRAKEKAEVGIGQLQRQTRFWLKRLAEVGVKLIRQLGNLQAGIGDQAPQQMQ